MGEIEQRPTPGSRLGAAENSGISTLEHGQKPPPTPSGKLMSVRIQMLDDTQEAFEVPVSRGQPSARGGSCHSCVSVMRGGRSVCSAAPCPPSPSSSGASGSELSVFGFMRGPCPGISVGVSFEFYSDFPYSSRYLCVHAYVCITYIFEVEGTVVCVSI